MKTTLATILIGLALCVSTTAQTVKPKPSHLTPAYSNAAITALNEWDDKKFHAFKIARDVEAKTSADKLSARRLEAFLMVHGFNKIAMDSIFDDPKYHEQLGEEIKCRDQWIQNLRYNDPDVPRECGLKF